MNDNPAADSTGSADERVAPNVHLTSDLDGDEGSRLSAWTRRMVTVEQTLAAVMLLLILLTMGAQVFARYVFGFPFSWSEELARFSMIWLTFLAASFVMAEGGHIAVDLLSSRLNPRARTWLDATVHLIIAFSCLLLLFGGSRFVWYVGAIGSPSLGIPRSWWYGAVGVGLALMATHSILNLFHVIRTGRPAAHRSMPEEEGFHLELEQH